SLSETASGMLLIPLILQNPSSDNQTTSGSHPFLYSRFNHLLASGTLVIVSFDASYFNNLFVLNARAYKLIASVIGSASRKLPAYCLPVLQASTNCGKASEV